MKFENKNLGVTMNACGSGQVYYFFNLGSVLFNSHFHTALQGHLVYRAAHTIAFQADFYQFVVLDGNQGNIPPVIAKERTDFFQGLLYLLLQLFRSHIHLLFTAEHPAMVVIFIASVGGRLLFLRTTSRTIFLVTSSKAAAARVSV